ncbi:hypothetical protein [Bartonella sp. DGB2]|uniref:hypothetical protein n=1 Tax=Bartonella sp. DGB2 TaxID=3388426 RepID=UPI00398FD4FF
MLGKSRRSPLKRANWSTKGIYPFNSIPKQAELSKLDDTYHLTLERLNAAKILFDKKVISQTSYLERLHEHKNIEHEITIERKHLAENKAEQETLQQQEKSLLADEYAQYQQMTHDAQNALTNLESQLANNQYRFDNFSLRAPVDGYVN